MTTGTATVIERSVQTTHEWLNDIERLAELNDDTAALSALRSVLHILRDRMPLEEAAHFASQLPTLIRGLYYESWRPVDTPQKLRSKDEFLAAIAEHLRSELETEPEKIAHAVFTVIETRVSGGQASHVRNMLPNDIQELWPINN